MKKLFVLFSLFFICNSVYGQVQEVAQTVNTISELLARPVNSSRKVYNCLGRTSVGDGGGGIVYWSSSSVAATNAGVIFPAAGVSTGRYIRRLESSEISIVWFGADGTAIADSRNAIQGAINYARSIGGIVTFPQGDFRVVQATSIYVGNVPLIGKGGKLWNSLPNGYYNPGSSVPETYSVSNVLDRYGAYVTFTYSSSWAGCWNGKGEMFLVVDCSLIKDLNIDGGWGTTGTPGNVVPIFGIDDSGDEFTYYQMFSTSNGTQYQNCNVSNVPGACIEGGYNIRVASCNFGEYGDHLLYFGQSASTQNTYTFANNQITLNRITSGTLGLTNYVGYSKRDALKFRGNRDIVVSGNICYSTVSTNTFVNLDVSDTQPGDIENVSIANNILSGYIFLRTASTRTGVSLTNYPTGCRIKNVSIIGNVIKDAVYGFILNGATDSLHVQNNIFRNIALLANICGDLNYTNSVKNISFINNYCVQTTNSTQPIFAIGGPVDTLHIKYNHFINPNNAQRGVISLAAYSANNGLPAGEMLTFVNELEVIGNYAENYLWWVAIQGYTAYDSGSAYSYSSITQDDGLKEIFHIVSSGGSFYKNSAAVSIGTAPPTSPWQTYTIPTMKLTMNDNIKNCSISALTPDNATYLNYGEPNSIRMMNCNLSSLFNINKTTLGETISYLNGSGFTENTDLYEVGNLFPPKMTKTQRNAIASPQNGMLIYQTDNTPGTRAYENGAWVKYTATADP